MAATRRTTSLAWSGWILASAVWVLVGCARDVPQAPQESEEESAPMTGPVNGPAGRLYVDDGGSGGLPVVFVHSYAGSGEHWAAQLAHLRPTRRAVALDLRGHGRSEAPAAGDYAVESQSLLTGARPEVAARIEKEMKSVPREASLAIIQAIFDYDPTPALKAYPGPKLLVDTSHGESPGALHNLAPEIPRKVVTGTSHWPQLDKPEELNRILDEFLATVK